MNAPDRRALVLGGLLTFVVAALVGVLSVLTALAGLVSVRFDPAASDPAAVLGSWVVYAFLALAGAAYLALPVAVAVGLVRAGRSRLHAATWVGCAWLLPVAGAVAGAGVVAHGFPRLVLAVPVVLLGLVVAGHSLARSRHGDRGVPWAAFGNVALVAVVLAGLYVGVVGGTAATGLVESDRSSDPVGRLPQTDFGYAYRPVDDGRAVVTIIHEAGDTLDASNVSVVGALVTVEGANQTESGGWRGSTTLRDGDRVVTRGDSVAVGVRSDCADLRVVWDGGDVPVTIGVYDCPASR